MAKRKPLLIGEASRDGGRPLDGPSGRRLAEAAGIPDLYARFDVINLFPDWPGRANGKGDAFPKEMARTHALSLRAQLARRQRVVFLGRRVAEAFLPLTGADLPYLFWWPEDAPQNRTRFAIVPHPSGVNLWWNDPENREAAAEFMRALASGKEPK